MNPLHHCFMASSILADDIKYFKHHRAVFGALNGRGIKNASKSLKAEKKLIFQKYFTSGQESLSTQQQGSGFKHSCIRLLCEVYMLSGFPPGL